MQHIQTQRGGTHSWSDGKGGQRVEDCGPFGQERQRTLDEFTAESKRFIRDAVEAESTILRPA